MSEYICNKCGQDIENKEDECPICNGDIDPEDTCTFKRKDSQGQPCIGYAHNFAGGCKKCSYYKKNKTECKKNE